MQKVLTYIHPICKSWGFALELSTQSYGQRKKLSGLWIQHTGLYSTTVDSLVKQQQKKRKKKEPATSVMHVHEEHISIEKTRVKRIKGSPLHIFSAPQSKSSQQGKSLVTQKEVASSSVEKDIYVGNEQNNLTCPNLRSETIPTLETELKAKSKSKKKPAKMKANTSTLTKTKVSERSKLENAIFNESLSKSIATENEVASPSFEGNFFMGHEQNNLTCLDLRSETIPTVETEPTAKLKAKKKPAKMKANTSTLRKTRVSERSILKNAIFNESLAAFISVCMYLGYDKQALWTFNNYNIDSKHNKVSIIAFNEILKKFSIQANYKDVKELLNTLRKYSIKPNVDTFAYTLSCLGHLKEDTFVKAEIKDLLEWMQNEDITLEDMFNYAIFPKDAYNFCLEAVKLVIPDFETKGTSLNSSLDYIKEKSSYQNKLVNSLNDSLFTNKIPSLVEGVITEDELISCADEQIKSELKGYITVPNIYKLHSTEKSDLEVQLEEVEEHWRVSLLSHLKTLKNLNRYEFMKKKCDYWTIYPFLSIFSDDDLIDLLIWTIKEYIWGNEFHSCSIHALTEIWGTQCYQYFYSLYCGKVTELVDCYKEYCRWYISHTPKDASYLPRAQWEKLCHDSLIKNNSSLRDYPPPWPSVIKRCVGKYLLNIIIASITIETKGNLQPVFSKVMRSEKSYKREELVVAPFVYNLFPRDAMSVLKPLVFSTTILPMISPPVPRTSLASGGYIMSNSDLVRLLGNGQDQINKLKEMKKSIYPVFDSLNQIGSVPWRINGPILDLMTEVYLGSGSAEFSIPLNPNELKPPVMSVPATNSVEKLKMRKAVIEYNKKHKEALGLWSHMLYKISIANMFRDKVIWLPLNLDFRGRAYTIHPHLSQYSDDPTRSLLHFAKGKKLGPDGLSWLKLHLVNLTGLKKRCDFNERIAYCDEVLDEILDSADNPIHGRRWWIKSDDPWQTLAACKELANALRSSDPENYVSHLPIHQDGSCNGLQHYAALGRDKAGAMSVNLTPSSKPQDVYSDVLELVEKTRKEDVEKSLPIAMQLEGFVERKVIKQTVMTNVYGVTLYGAKLQIRKKLEDMKIENLSLSEASTYLANHTFGSLGTLFTSAKSIQDWLINIAEGICRNLHQNVEWVTPLGFPVIQPYTKQCNQQLQEKLSIEFPMVPDINKQKNGFPPNFIHSLDASHMMLTSIYCQHAGVHFVSIHDCFWTHACNVPIMNKICREQFVSLYSLPILEDLADSFQKKYSNNKNFQSPLQRLSGEKTASYQSLETLLMNVPRKGDFILDEVLNSTFFFS